MAQKSPNHPAPAYGEVACGQWPSAAYGSGGPAVGDAIRWSSAGFRNYEIFSSEQDVTCY